MKVLVTGSTGFIGGYLKKKLEFKDVQYSNVLRSKEVSGKVGEDFFVNTINSRTCWEGAFSGVDVVIHLAGLAHNKEYSISDYKEVNLDGTINLAKSAIDAGVKKFVFVSSIGVNGSCTKDTPFSPHHRPTPHNDYSLVKYQAEKAIIELCNKSEMKYVIVRPTLVYGAGAPGNFASFLKLVKMMPMLPFGNACNKRHFIAVQNLADLLVTCAIHPRSGQNILLASDMCSVSIREFSDAIAKGLGKKVLQLPIPVNVMALVGKVTGRSKMIEQLYGNLEVDSSNISEILAWKPPHTMEQAMTTLRDSGENSK